MAAIEVPKETVVMFPSGGLGHVVPMVELGKRFIRRGLSVAVVVLPPVFNPAAFDAFISRTTASLPSISFHCLPPVPIPQVSSPHREAVGLALLRLAAPLFAGPLASITAASSVRALVLDFFCTDALDAAAPFRLPTYFYFTSSGCDLAAFLHLPELHRRMIPSFKDLGDAPVDFPGLPPIPASDILSAMQDREDEAYKGMIYHFDRLLLADGIIVNAVRSLEARAIAAVEEGLCVPGRPVPPIYCVGPLVGDATSEERHDCLSWLDRQPRNSVVFLCFGSMGMFSADQLKEIAAGLERSGQRFLWVVRSPPSGDQAKTWAMPEPDLAALLPEGFLSRTEGRGMVVKLWAPQVVILNHEAVGGFVTHCGWNSVMEAVCAGVPMIAWPLYAEQRMNKVFLVEELRLAVEMRGYGDGTVVAEEVEARVRWLMDEDGGRQLRERAMAAREAAVAAVAEGGESDVALMELVNAWKQGGAEHQ